MTTDRAILKLARAEYHRRASLMGESEVTLETEPATPTRRERSRKQRRESRRRRAEARKARKARTVREEKS